ncbi:MAG: type II secretion system F family protein [Myxococcales bacterium]|jgi:tight adherence protein B
MSNSLTWLLWAGSVLSIAGAATVVHLTLVHGMGPVAGVFADHEARLNRHTTFLMSSVRGSQVARAQLLTVGAALVLWIGTRQAPFLLLVLVAALAPQVVLRKQHVARVAKLESQLDTWLLMLANALKATSSVADAIASTVALAPRPFRDELDLLVKEIRLGIPLDRALQSTGLRIGSAMISGALGAIIVARQTGGDLPRALERAAAALRESARLEGVLRAKTAEGRGQVVVLAVAPFLLCVIISWLDPGWFDPMLDRTYGRAILGACALSWLVAVVWSHHIVRADL